MWVAQMFLGLRHLHEACKIIHRDLKPDNVLLTEGARCAKLADFGMSKQGEAKGNYSLLKTLPPGSPHYVAPEGVMRAKYDFTVDFYSFGVTVWVLLTGGVKNYADPRPPCYDHHGDLSVLAKNWALLKEAVDSPDDHKANALPSDNNDAAKDFVKRLTRSTEVAQRRCGDVVCCALWRGQQVGGVGIGGAHDGYMTLSHEYIRTHPLLERLQIPIDDRNISQYLQQLDSQFP